MTQQIKTIMTQINMTTNRTITTLFKLGLTCKEIREHYNETKNSALNNHINVYVTSLRKNKYASKNI